MSRTVREPDGHAVRAFAGDVAAASRAAWRSPVTRLAFGVAVSAAFLAVTLSRVDLAETARAIARAAPAGLLAAVVLVLVEMAIRAERWRLLLRPSAVVPLRATFGLLGIGYFANTLLPARLGDAVRAYLAGRLFGIPILTALGTIVVERILDTAAIVGIVLLAGLVVAPSGQVVGSAAVLAAALVIGLASVTIAGVVLANSRLLSGRFGTIVRAALGRAARGAASLQHPRGAAVIVGLTLLPFGVAVGAFGAVTRAVGLELGPTEWALVLGVLALSTALPAAPGSLGTYEFVGVTVLGVLGVAPSQALAATVLVHAVAVIPTALVGLAATLRLNLRIGDLLAGATSTDVPAAG